jgi:hypothetical protein
MPQPQLQGLHTGLPVSQKSRATVNHRLERLLQINDGLDFRLEVAAFAKSLAGNEGAARRRLACQSHVKIQHRGRPQAACKAGPRQTQQLSHPGDSHRMQGLQPLDIPRRASQG